MTSAVTPPAEVAPATISATVAMHAGHMGVPPLSASASRPPNLVGPVVRRQVSGEVVTSTPGRGHRRAWMGVGRLAKGPWSSLCLN